MVEIVIISFSIQIKQKCLANVLYSPIAIEAPPLENFLVVDVDI